MREICIPIPHFGENQVAEVEVMVNGKKKKYDFKVESFLWGIDQNELDSNRELSESELKVNKLRKLIKEYDNQWQIVQIYTPPEGSKYIQVLFRKRSS